MATARHSPRGPAQGRSAPASAALVVRAKPNGSLRASQLLFNRLTRRIDVLRKRIPKERERLEGLLGRFLLEVGPVESELASQQLELAHALSAAYRRWPLRHDETEDLRRLILVLTSDVLRVSGRDEAAEALRNEWFRPMGERVRNADDEEPQRKTGSRVRARDLRKRRHRTEQESVRLKSVRAIYLALAKVLHPDASRDDSQERERDMKRATEAYRQEDLVTLLELEQRWGTRDGEELRDLGDDVLAVYTTTLRLRVKTLEQELEQQVFNPRFSRIAPVAGLSVARAARGIADRAEQLRGDRRRVEELLAKVAECRGKRVLGRLVRAYLDYEDLVPDEKLAAMSADDDA